MTDLGRADAERDKADVDVPAAGDRGYARRRAAEQAAIASARAKSEAGPIDHVHLARYTLGDRELEIEVLGLFAGEAPLTVTRLHAAAVACPFDQRAWTTACHTLKGSARAVGATRVATLAEQAERTNDLQQAALATHVAKIEDALQETSAYIRGLGDACKAG